LPLHVTYGDHVQHTTAMNRPPAQDQVMIYPWTKVALAHAALIVHSNARAASQSLLIYTALGLAPVINSVRSPHSSSKVINHAYVSRSITDDLLSHNRLRSCQLQVRKSSSPPKTQPYTSASTITSPFDFRPLRHQCVLVGSALVLLTSVSHSRR
jgi:hypothetical protein